MSSKHSNIKKKAKIIYEKIKPQFESIDTKEITFEKLKKIDLTDVDLKNIKKHVKNQILGLVYRTLKQTNEGIFQIYIKKLKRKKNKKNLFFSKSEENFTK